MILPILAEVRVVSGEQVLAAQPWKDDAVS
jgi:hypothetical protein